VSPADLTSITFRRAPVTEIYPLRDAVLIANTNRDSPVFDGDDAPTTLHLGAFDGEQCIGCVSFMTSRWRDEPALQLRGMAIDPAWQGRGAGAALLRFAEQQVIEQTDTKWLWCNARIGAAGFYQKHGWQQEGDAYDIPGVGPHVKLWRALAG